MGEEDEVRKREAGSERRDEWRMRVTGQGRGGIGDEVGARLDETHVRVTASCRVQVVWCGMVEWSGVGWNDRAQ